MAGPASAALDIHPWKGGPPQGGPPSVKPPWRGEAGADVQAEADSPVPGQVLTAQAGSRMSAVGAGTVINAIN